MCPESGEIIFIGLNISRPIENPLGNFHDPRPMATDFKIRYALKDTPYWGGYMTDIIKDFEEKASGKMMKYLKTDPAFEKENDPRLTNTFESSSWIYYGRRLEGGRIFSNNPLNIYQINKYSFYKKIL